MRKVMKAIKVEKKKKKHSAEKTCLEVLHEVAKAMSNNCEIEIRIVHPETRIHLMPSVDDEYEKNDCRREITCGFETMKQLFKGDDACCGSCCDHPFADMGLDREDNGKNQNEKADRAEAGESM